ncbi:MAG: alpha/beta fold hydrolase [Gemmatimonadota bacterium]|nr:MAG: alpha/beta fold hydrolase [Gemmatimonadota bacterium]
MHRTLSALAVMALLVPAVAQERTLDAGILRFVQGGVELGRETFRRTETVFETSTSVPVLNLKLDYRTTYDASGRVQLFEAKAFDLVADTIRRAYHAIADGDSLRCTQIEASGAERSWAVAAAPDLVTATQSVAAFAELVQRANRSDTSYSAWSPELNQLTEITVAFRGDTADVQTPTLPLTAILGPDGRVSVVEIAVQRVRAERAGAETLPPLEGLTRPEPNYEAPRGAPFTAEQVWVPVNPEQGDAFELAGTLTVPKAGTAPYPAAIMITGSGGQNRDEELWPLVEGYRPFRQTAERLAAVGIAVLRVDDRGVGGSGGARQNATTPDLANDVRAQVDWIRARPEIDPDRIALIGHSEGGIIGPMVAATDSRIAAVVIMAGSSKNGVEILKDQATWPVETAPGLSPERRAELVELALDAVVADTANPSAWIRWFRTYDPLPTAREVKQPVLILHGALDRQVSVGQADTLEQVMRESGNPDVSKHIFPRLNHLFLESLTDGSPSEYMALTDVEVPDRVLDALAVWLAERLKAGQ